MSSKAEIVYLSLGSNLENREVNLEQAQRELTTSLAITNWSSIYETPPWGYTPQPAFLNQVLEANTTLTPLELLVFVKSIERKMGRVKNFRNGPRLIDIDILLYGDQLVNTADLVIPHPRMLERGFVLVPLAEIASGLVIPGTSMNVEEALQKVDESGIQKVVEPGSAKKEG